MTSPTRANTGARTNAPAALALRALVLLAPLAPLAPLLFGAAGCSGDGGARDSATIDDADGGPTADGTTGDSTADAAAEPCNNRYVEKVRGRDVTSTDASRD